MQKVIAVLVLFLTPATYAAEIRYASYPAGAPASHARLLVWSAGGDLHINQVGIRGEVLATHTIDDADAELTAPSVAGDGTAYLVAFVRRERDGETKLGVIGVDAAGTPGVVHSYPSGLEAAPQLVRTPGAYAVWSERTMYMLDRDGRLLTESPGRAPAGIAAAGDAVLVFNSSADPGGVRCTIGGRSCQYFEPWTTLDWTISRSAAQRSGSVTWPWWWNLQPVAAGDASTAEFLIAWISPAGAEALAIRDGREPALIKVPAPANPSSRASIAFDGSRYLLVFETLGDIYGAFLDADEPVARPFPIAASVHGETLPHVTAVARGRFLVTYRSGSTAVPALAGRIVTAPGVSYRRRAVN